jgi:hypothetical protein
MKSHSSLKRHITIEGNDNFTFFAKILSTDDNILKYFIYYMINNLKLLSYCHRLDLWKRVYSDPSYDNENLTFRLPIVFFKN